MFLKICLLFICLISLLSCRKKSVSLQEIIPSFIAKGNSELSNSTFFIGPQLDSVEVDIIADCDCCASNIAFNDSSFFYIELCMGGNSYVKGDYVIVGDKLILRTNKKIISEEYEVGSMDENVPISYEVIEQRPNYLIYEISDLKGKQIITYSKDDYTEYGMRDTGSVVWFMKEWRKEKILNEYLKDF